MSSYAASRRDRDQPSRGNLNCKGIATSFAFLGDKSLSSSCELPQEELDPATWEWALPVLTGVTAESGRGIQAEKKFYRGE